MRTIKLFALGALVSTMAMAPASLGRPARSIGPLIMPVGDSITLGAGYDGGYRGILEHMLRAHGYTFKFIGGVIENSKALLYKRHEGHGGWSTNDLLNGRDGQPQAGKLALWLHKWKPDTLIVMTGTNDDWWIGRDAWAQKYDKVLRTIFAYNANTKVVMVSIPKSNDAVTGKEGAEAMCYDIVKSAVTAWARKGYKVAFADCYTSFNPQTDLSDNYHPNEAGYQKIANAVYTALIHM